MAHMLPIGSPLGVLDLRFALRPPMGGCAGVVLVHYFAIVHEHHAYRQESREWLPYGVTTLSSTLY